MSTPFDDLDPEELKKLVDFCQDFFLDGLKWEWKRGDWYVTFRKCHPGGEVVINSIKLLDYDPWMNQRPPSDAVPLPLAHQWLQVINRDGNHIELKPYGVGFFQARCLDPETKGIVHKNAAYACFLATEVLR